MKIRQYTDWFDGSVKPVHIGIYERLYPDYKIEYCYWDGTQWYADIYPDNKWVSAFQHIKWRGILKSCQQHH